MTMCLRCPQWLALSVLGLAGMVAMAQPVPASTPAAAAAPAAERSSSWTSLTPAQRTTLAPLEHEWGNIDPLRQRKWLEIALRCPRLSVEEQERVQQRMAEWARMTPQERGRARVQFQETRQLSAQERQAGWEAYQALPAEEKRELAQRAVPATPRIAASATEASAKSSIVRIPAGPPVLKPVGPTLMQVAPGATTTSVTRPPAPPLHQQPGLPKMAATPIFVDKNTLLPKRGAQAAATVSEPAASQAASRP
jgi:hypothetical protein